MKLKIMLSLCVCCLILSASHAQGKLNRAKSDLSGSSSSSSSSSSRSSNDDDDWGDGAGFFDGVFLEIAYHATVGILFGDMEPRYFYEYPYSDGSHGEYAFGDENIPLKNSQLIFSNTFFASGKEFYGNDVKLNFRFIPVMGVELNHLHFFEDRPKNNLGATSFMLNFYRVREKHVTAFWGVGFTHIGNGVDETGFTYQVGVDVFLNKPYSISALWKQSLINDSTVDEFKLHIRRHLKRFSVHGGFNHYQLGSVNINAFSIGVDYRF